VRYLICNADESEPGTFKDRLIMEGDPHRVIEGIAIAAYAIGAQEAYIYLRGEYPLAAERLEVAIGQAHEAGLLGERVLGSGFSLDVHLHRGAGAYICGEETALIESLEGKRGVPRVRPPYPPSYGLWGRPTVVNNVETLANLPEIVRLGADWYRERGTEGSPGTKVYTILGDVHRPMAFEAPLGLSVAEAVETYGGGTLQDRTVHIAQTGGSAGNIVPAERLSVPLDYASAKNGVSLGSGAMLIGHSQRKAMDFLAPVVNFFRVESCGQCTPCREGLVRAQEILGRLASSEGVERDLLLLDILAEALCDGSFCGLGMAAATPLKDGLSHFREELLNGEGSLEFLGLRLTPKIKGQGLDERARAKVGEVLARRSKEQEAIVDTLREINGRLGYLPPEALQLVGEAYRMEPSLVYGLASFYSLLSVAPRGKHVVRLCNSAPCYLGGEGQVMEAVKEALGLEVGETTADGLFTLETTSCLGLCAVGPVMSVDEKVYGRLTPERAVEMLEGIKGQESHAGRGHK
jgi:NADH:ubiquinone oxidoreductase subunit F (NADH-binding)/NADH:ubiquinone oxidoreductase subunit E